MSMDKEVDAILCQFEESKQVEARDLAKCILERLTAITNQDALSAANDMTGEFITAAIEIRKKLRRLQSSRRSA